MSTRIVGDTEGVATNAQWLNRSIAGLLLLLVTVAGVLTYRSVVNANQEDEATAGLSDVVEFDPDGPERAYSGQQLTFDDVDFPLTLSCLPSVGSTEVYVVIITNDGRIEADWVVAADLITDNGPTVEATTEVNNLLPDETRESILVPDEEPGAIDDCTITAIQGERRVLLNR